MPRALRTQRNDVSGNGLLIGTLDGSVHVNTNACAAPNGTRGPDSAGGDERMPVEGELAMLAEAGAVALVTAMGTSAWVGVRDAVARLFDRARSAGHEKVSDRLDDGASFVAAAGDPAAARAALKPVWLLQLTELLSAAPDCASGLSELIRVFDQAGSPPGTHWEQHNIVRDSARAFIALGGNVTFHGNPDPPESADGGTGGTAQS
jgi:hypothetical protein